MYQRSPPGFSFTSCPVLREIGGRRREPDAPVVVIGEIRVNHGGSIALGFELDLGAHRQVVAGAELAILEAS